MVGSSDLVRFFADLYRRHFVALGARFLVRFIRDGYVRRQMATRIPHVLTAVRSRLGSGRISAPDPGAWPPAQLLSIGVATPYRGLGVAEELTERFCSALAADGITEVGLSVLNANDRAIAFYEKSGWTRRGADAASMSFWRPLGPAGGSLPGSAADPG